MRYLKLTLIVIATIFLGCGGTDIKTKSANVSATTADGISYNFSGNIIAQWRSYTLQYDDRIEVVNMRVEVNSTDYPSNWSWSRKIEDLKSSDIRDEETSISFSFDIKLPESSKVRDCVLKYTLTLDNDRRDESINCSLPTK